MMCLVFHHSEEGAGALAAETAKRKWPLYRVKPKVHMMNHITILGITLQSAWWP